MGLEKYKYKDKDKDKETDKDKVELCLRHDIQASAKLEAKQQSREDNLVKQCQRSKQAKTS